MPRINKQIADIETIISVFAKNSNFPQSTTRLYLTAVKHFLFYIKTHHDKFDDCLEASQYYCNFLARIYRNNTFIAYTSGLQQVLTWAVATKVIDSDIEINLPHLQLQQGIKVIKSEKITKSELLRLVNFATNSLEDLRDLIIIQLILYYNLSANQLVQLAIFDIVEVEGKTRIFVFSKGKKNKFVEIDKNLRILLLKYLELLPKQKPNKDIDLTKLKSIFISFANVNYGESIIEKTIARIIQKRLIEARIDHYQLTINQIKGKLAKNNQ